MCIYKEIINIIKILIMLPKELADLHDYFWRLYDFLYECKGRNKHGTEFYNNLLLKLDAINIKCKFGFNLSQLR